MNKSQMKFLIFQKSYPDRQQNYARSTTLIITQVHGTLLRQSMDIYGKYEGGGVCEECKHFTTGTNCHTCVDGYFRLKPQIQPRFLAYIFMLCFRGTARAPIFRVAGPDPHFFWKVDPDPH
jgi:hypothetical protein